MANYLITDYDTGVLASVSLVTAALETYLETIDDTSTIYGMEIIKAGTGGFIGYVIHKTV